MTARREMVWVMVLAAVMVAAPVSAQDHDDMLDVSGEWEIPLGHGPSGDMTWYLALTAGHEGYGGVLSIPDFGEFPLDAVELDGHELVIRVSAGGNSVVFRGTVSGNEYVGDMSGLHDEPPFEFIGERKDR